MPGNKKEKGSLVRANEKALLESMFTLLISHGFTRKELEGMELSALHELFESMPVTTTDLPQDRSKPGEQVGQDGKLSPHRRNAPSSHRH